MGCPWFFSARGRQIGDNRNSHSFNDRMTTSRPYQVLIRKTCCNQSCCTEYTGTGTWSVLKYNFRVLVLACQVLVLVLVLGPLVLVLVLVRKYLLPRQSHFLLYWHTLASVFWDSECLHYWFLCPSFTIWHYLADLHFISFFWLSDRLSLRQLGFL